VKRLRILHAIHDFLPRHVAGSEIYAYELARELSREHDVFVTAAEYDPGAPHGTIRWRSVEGLPVVEVVNNWEFDRFEDTYSSPRLNRQLGHVLDATAPDVLHVHNLLNLSLDLPRLARERGMAVAATLHDYTLVCPSGGQRVHAAEAHVCEAIDPDRCSRCFSGTAFRAQWAVGRLTKRPVARRLVAWGGALRHVAAGAAERVARQLPAGETSAADIRRRLAYARHVFEQVDLFVAPSAALAYEYVRLGLDPRRIEVSDYGFVRQPSATRADDGAARFGFVGTLAWHKGAHVLLEALRRVHGEFRLDVYGDERVAPQYSAGLRQAAAGLPVTFRGPFDRARLPETYASFDVLVVPSLWPENSPLVIHEAFMHGAAVVASRMGGIPELVRDGVNGYLYDATSPQALAGCLQPFVNDRSLAARLAAGAPPIKPIEEDAREWERRYAALALNRSASVLPI
jgi:glycosyltransferase involved in cell wall biosynthesis